MVTHMHKYDPVNFTQTPNLTTSRQIYGLNSFQVNEYNNPVPTYRGKIGDTYQAVVNLNSSRGRCDLSLCLEDAFILGLHLMKLGARGKSAHERMQILSELLQEEA